MSTCNWLGLESLGSWPIIPKFSSDTVQNKLEMGRYADHLSKSVNFVTKEAVPLNVWSVYGG